MHIVPRVVNVKGVGVSSNLFCQRLEIADLQEALKVAGTKDLVLQQATALEGATGIIFLVFLFGLFGSGFFFLGLLIAFFILNFDHRARFCVGLVLSGQPLLAEFALGVGLLGVVEVTSRRRLLTRRSWFPRRLRLRLNLRGHAGGVPAAASLPDHAHWQALNLRLDVNLWRHNGTACGWANASTPVSSLSTRRRLRALDTGVHAHARAHAHAGVHAHHGVHHRHRRSHHGVHHGHPHHGHAHHRHAHAHWHHARHAHPHVVGIVATPLHAWLHRHGGPHK
mmetsp:Transcript_728/g.1961  ORF Transcript_728/g.1961 Transcript_728/m.1961 type:complete len:281 (-) Transcript_728:75-917(-)